MRNLALFLIAGLGISACQTTVQGDAAAASGARQLATQEDLTAVIGRTITFNGPARSFVISPNGTLNGNWDGQPLVGTYEMRDGFFCRTLSQGPSGPAPEDCQLFILNGNSLMMTRNRGEGVENEYILI